jgi:hypothetical protein
VLSYAETKCIIGCSTDHLWLLEAKKLKVAMLRERNYYKIILSREKSFWLMPGVEKEKKYGRNYFGAAKWV